MSRQLLTVTAVLLAYAATAFAQGTQSAQPPRTDQDAPQPFRVSVDVVAVDVQVVDRNGQPVPDLGPEKFSVTINGRKRRVVSAERISSDTGEESVSSGPTATVRGRVIMLAVDCVSFDATASRGVIQASKQFVQQLTPDDFVGLAAYPNGPKLAPTRDHAAVLRALDNVVGQRDLAELGQFNLRPSEIIDFTRELQRGGGPTVDSITRRECGDPYDPFCQHRLITDTTGTALYMEGEGTASLGVLRSLVSEMSGFPGRKTVVLVSGGIIASDTPGGRPDLADLGIIIGKEAALANTAVYTLFIDSSFIDRFTAQTRKGDKNLGNWNRDSALLSRWLEQFTGAAGGALFNIQVGNAESAFSRIRSELASYYLLGVEPADEDRDGRTHEISVKTSHPNVTIRGRRWVMVPLRRGGPIGATKAAAKTAAPAEPTPAPAAEPAPAAPVPRVVPAEVQAIADAFDRGNYAAVEKALSQPNSLANLLRAFRISDTPWPNDPKRTAVFALEMAFAGLRSNNLPAREEGARLLAEYHTRVRQPNGADAFECSWFLTEAAALEGLFMPESALTFIPRAVQRCPTTPRLQLAYAFISEQQWLRGGMTPAQQLEVVDRYEAAMKFPETEFEARVRGARYLYGLGNFDKALEVLNGATRKTSDKELLYLADLIRGQVQRARGQHDEAVAAFRSALATWPGAQSSRVALMTLLVNRGDREGAAALAEAAQTASDDEFDPWWTYWLGDFRSYPAMLDHLRGLGR